MGGGIGQENSYLAIFDLPRRPAVLALHPHRLGPLLQETGLVYHQYFALLAQMLHHVVPQVIANQVGIPDVGGQQSLHPVGRGVARLLRQLPPVLALYRRKQSLQIVQRPSPGFRTVKPSGNTPMDSFDTCGTPGHLCHLVLVRCHHLTSPTS